MSNDFNQKREALLNYAKNNSHWACDTNSSPTDYRIWLEKELKDEQLFHKNELAYEANEADKLSELETARLTGGEDE